MRLLHTSDWHLGRSLHRADLRDAQATFLDSLIETVRAERVDAVLVAGDVYDRAVPSLDAVELCESALVRLRDAGARVVLISGNHDSARRLGFGSRLVDAAGVHLRTRVTDCATPVLLEDSAGPVAVYGVPYLESEAVRAELPPETGRGHGAVLAAALDAVRGDLTGRGVRSVVLAHAWVGQAVPSDSERDITVGGVASVAASLFDGFTYSALGHLHGPQALAEGLRYSGSPLAYSFSEAAHTKGSWLVELSAAGLARVEHVAAPVPRRLSTVRGTLPDLLSSPSYASVAGDWLQVTLTDAARPDEAMARLTARFPHVLVLRHEPAGAVTTAGTYAARVAGRTPVEVGEAFVEHVRGTPAEDTETALLAAAIEDSRLRGAA
jgi:exonuclease SbcD